MRKDWEHIFDRWIFKSYSIPAAGLACCRIFYASYTLFFAAGRMDWIGGFPQVFYKAPPYSFAALFTGFPPPFFFHVINLLFVGLLIMILVGWKTKIASIAFSILAVLATSFIFSLGKIDHIILFTVTPFIMAFTNWGSVWSIDGSQPSAKHQIESWPITLLSLIIGFTMFTSGYWKAISSWLDLNSLAIQSKLYSNFYARNRTDLLADYFIEIRNPIIWELADWAIVLYEILFIIVIISPVLFRFWISICVIFHLVVLLMLNIDFSIHMVAFAPFINYQMLGKLVGSRLARVNKIITKAFSSIVPHHVLLFYLSMIFLLYKKENLAIFIFSLFGLRPTYANGLIFIGLGSILVLIFWCQNLPWVLKKIRTYLFHFLPFLKRN
jgi:hypothetical protein